MTTTTKEPTAMNALFRGLSRAHGHFEISGKKDSGKLEGKAETKKEPVTPELWRQHVQGEYSLGIMPVDEQGNCWWGCIDVDVYPLDLKAISKRITESNLPLLICQSKSGGAHLFLFLRHQLPASEVRSYLQSYLEPLGLKSDTEIFPKQTKAPAPSQTGNWLNMPYFGDTRHMWRDGEELPLEDFLRLAKDKRITREQLQEVRQQIHENHDPLLDAPPCLQHLYQAGLPEGSRNSGLFSFGILAKKAKGEDFESYLREIKGKVCPEFSDSELDGLIASVGRSNAFYKCTDHPLLDHCDKDTCRKCKFGIGGTHHKPDYPDMKYFKNFPPRPRSTIGNLEALMDFLDVKVKYNLITKRAEVEGLECPEGEEENTVLAFLASEAAKYDLPVTAVDRFTSHIAMKNAYNSVTAFLDLLPPAQGDPIGDFVDYCEFPNADFAKIALRLFFLQAVAAADNGQRSPLHYSLRKFGLVLVFEGGQGVGKSTLLSRLLGNKKDWYLAGSTLNITNKDDVVIAISQWMTEMCELNNTTYKSKIESMKAFIDREKDTLRIPYARGASQFPRRTVFLGTVNEVKFLMDDTGNRRFWPLTMSKRIETFPEGLRDRVLGWAWQQYLLGTQWWPNEEEEAAHARAVKPFEGRTMEEMLCNCYDFDSKEPRGLELTSDQILDEIGIPRAKHGDRIRLGNALTELGVKNRYGRQRKYNMPERIAANRYFTMVLPDGPCDLPMQ